ncbi:TPA: hypothetical protein PTW06_001898 [Clostridium botulinum]|nr:hypothetical protein [Clostridium botulinum]HDK7223190.1 hypothetical protein [Clostridium botulinum]HDK7272040.1 hypothetical protein [Clostridium botulinum]HDK7305391.1 hypothetical protein [Clostridium botulinum]
MKYLFYEKETNEKARVTLIYKVQPPANMLQEGNYITVENLKQEYGVYCNPVTDEIWYEDTDDNLEEQVKLITENLAQEKINNMKKDALAIDLTKEVASLKIEVMNLKKGGN